MIRTKHIKSSSLYVARIAIMTALLTSAKFALSYIPNVEIVTILIMVYSSCFGLLYALPSTILFCFFEMILYGFNTWVPLYFVYWSLLAFVSFVFLRSKKLLMALIIAIIMSILFGVLSAACDTLFCVVSLTSDQLQKYFIAYYLRGISFDIIHTVSNAIIVLVLYKPLVEVSKRIMPKPYNSMIVKSSHLIYSDYLYEREERN